MSGRLASATFLHPESTAQDRERTLEKVRLVEEQDDARLRKPSTVRDRLEQSRRFVHPVDVRVFVQCLVVFRDRDEEDEDVDILETVNPAERVSKPLVSAICNGERCERKGAGRRAESVNAPLLPLRALSADIKHDIVELSNREPLLRQARCLYSRSQDVLIGRGVVLRSYPFCRVEITARWSIGGRKSEHWQQSGTGCEYRTDRGNALGSRVVQLKLATLADTRLGRRVSPQCHQGVRHCRVEHRRTRIVGRNAGRHDQGGLLL